MTMINCEVAMMEHEPWRPGKVLFNYKREYIESRATEDMYALFLSGEALDDISRMAKKSANVVDEYLYQLITED